MHNEADFLRKLLENPADDATRLVYADWLDEQGDPESETKAEFLRLTARMLDPNRPKDDDATLRKLAAKLDMGWLAVVSRLDVDNCARRREARMNNELRERFGIHFSLICDKRWADLTVTDDRSVRVCDRCGQNVHYCDTITAARNHAQRGHCVAVDLGIIRRDGDLEPAVDLLGEVTVEEMDRERKRTGIDKVSAERERRKREKAGNG